MAENVPYSFKNSMINFTASSSSIDFIDSFEDVCSICLDPFTSEDPSNITGCKHDYHLQCILEWSQRSKECPICWQDLILKDPSSQELLAAVGIERTIRGSHGSPSTSTLDIYHLSSDFDNDVPDSYESGVDSRIMQHIAAAASRMERQISSGLNPTQIDFSATSRNMSDDQTRTSLDESLYSACGIVVGDSSNSNTPPTVTSRPLLHLDPSVGGNTVSTAAVSTDGSFRPRIILSQSPPDIQQRSSPNELSFSESMKLRLSAASSRCKESISKGTLSFKEKLLARKTSVKELSKGVHREMNAGITGVAKVLERLDLTPKPSGSSVSDSRCAMRSSNTSLNGKRLEDIVLAQSQNGNDGELPNCISSGVPHVYATIPSHVKVSPAQSGQ